ncbi:MAG: class I SAM-dependent methyltransferase [Betaproteobacteria bacterium]
MSGAPANGARAGSHLRDADAAPATAAAAQPPAAILLPPLLSAFIARVRQESPMHRGFLDQALLKLTRDERGELEGYLAFCAARDLSIDHLAKCYRTVVADALREQLYFQRHGRYRYTSFADVARHVYFDREYMSFHLYGLALSAYLWPNHLELFRFFRETLPKDRRGRYLEIGPGHGYFFRNAIELSRYDSFLGVDVSETSIQQTRDLVAHDATGRAADVRLECLDFLDAKFPEDGFDAIVMGEVLEHVEQPEHFLRRIAALARGDCFIFVTTCINAPAIDHIYLFRDLAEVKALFDSCGFHIRQERICPHAGKSVDECLAGRYAINVGYVLESTRTPVQEGSP